MLNPICCPRNQVIYRDYEFDHLLELTQRKDVGIRKSEESEPQFIFIFKQFVLT